MAGKKPIEEEKLDQVTGGVGGTIPDSDVETVETTSEMNCDQSETGYHIITDYVKCICERCHKKVLIRNTSGGFKA